VFDTTQDQSRTLPIVCHTSLFQQLLPRLLLLLLLLLLLTRLRVSLTGTGCVRAASLAAACSSEIKQNFVVIHPLKFGTHRCLIFGCGV